MHFINELFLDIIESFIKVRLLCFFDVTGFSGRSIFCFSWRYLSATVQWVSVSSARNVVLVCFKWFGSFAVLGRFVDLTKFPFRELFIHLYFAIIAFFQCWWYYIYNIIYTFSLEILLTFERHKHLVRHWIVCLHIHNGLLHTNICFVLTKRFVCFHVLKILEGIYLFNMLWRNICKHL